MAQFDFEKPTLRARVLSGLRGLLTGRVIGVAAIALAIIALVYYPLGMAILHKIDDDTTFTPANAPQGGSRAVAITAALVDREIHQNGWRANDPFFLPGAALDNMPEYQQGIVAAAARFAVEMTDQIGRTRGSSQADPDLEKAAGLLKYPGTVWLFDLSVSWAPTASSETQYAAAVKALQAYNQRLANGQAVFERRADNLISLLDRVAADLGSASAIIDRQIIEGRASFVDTRADNVFYNVKGKLYAYYLILRELGLDYSQLLREREAHGAWAQMLESLHESAILDPLLIMNGSTDGLFLANHLAVQGFYLLRARTQLRELSAILQK